MTSVLDGDEVGARKAWLLEADRVIHQVCEEHVEVTTAVIWPQLSFPPGDGRLLGKSLHKALRAGWLEKAQDAEGHWLAWDHLDVGHVRSADGVLIRQKSLVAVYRSLIFGR